MFRSRHCAGGLVVFALFVAPLRAEAPASPLRLMPDQAELLLQIKQPRRLVETITSLDEIKQLQNFSAIKEALGSTNVRRFYQLVAYFERKLGASWPELLDRLAGGGLAVSVKVGPNPAPALLVVQGTDGKLMAQFAQIGLELIEQEMARQEKPVKIEKGSYQGLETASLGKEFHAAVVGPSLLIANNDKTLHAALDLHLGRGQKSMADKPGVAESADLLPKETLVSLWYDMEYARQTPQGKSFFTVPRDAPLTVVAGGLLDVLGRTPYVCAGFAPDKDSLLLTVRMPRGREGMGMEQALHLPPPGQPGSRPLLEPRGVFYSTSFYLDPARFWLDRAYLFNDNQAKGIEKADKNVPPFLAGIKLSKILTQAGPYFRFVAANQTKTGYQRTPKQPIPAFALVTELREPEAFSKAMDGVLRGAALLGGARFNLKLVEEKYKDCQIVGYRFPEDGTVKEDINDIRFGFSPCYVTVGNQFVACSTLELCRELIDLLQQEAKAPPSGSPAAHRTKLYAVGGAEALAASEDQLIAQTILDRAATLEEARAEVKAIIALLRKLGGFTIDETFSARDLHYDFRLRLR
jgi:hypothetical protein